MDHDDLVFESANWLEDEQLLSKIDEDLDFALAFSLQEEFNEQASQETAKNLVSAVSPSKKIVKDSKNIIDSKWELIDPTPNIQALFLEFNVQFFYGRLDCVEVRWSPNMTLCAGLCCYEGRGGLCSIRLSTPLLKLRPRKDLVETLLHEMIHAYLFITENNKDRDAHGPEFHMHMYRINKASGTNITVYHTFHDEVDFYRQHWWKCDGPCQHKKPYYGMVKRAMNRAPSSRDPWWAQHQASCGGTYHKVREPDGYKQKATKRKLPIDTQNGKSAHGIKDFFNSKSEELKTNSSSVTKKQKENDAFPMKSNTVFDNSNNVVSVHEGIESSSEPPRKESYFSAVPFSGKGFKLGSTADENPKSLLSKIRKELGESNSKGGSLETDSRLKENHDFKHISTNRKTNKKDSSDDFGSPSMKNGKNKLIQSSLDKFVSTPLKSTTQGNSNATSSVGNLSKKPDFFENVGSQTSVIDLENDNQHLPILEMSTVKCPVCFVSLLESHINSHLDQCLQVM